MGPKDPPVVKQLPPNPANAVGGTGTIIINKDKLKALQKILPTIGSKQEEESKEGPKRVVVPPGTGSLARKTVTGGVKNRLGKTGSVKSRLGAKDEGGKSRAATRISSLSSSSRRWTTRPRRRDSGSLPSSRWISGEGSTRRRV